MPFRVLHVFDHSWPVLDGYSQRSRSIVKAQAQLGMQPSIVTGPSHQFDDPEALEVEVDNIHYFRTPAAKGVSAQLIRNRWPILREMALVHLLKKRILELLNEGSFDIIHAHSPALCGLAALQAARSRRIPFVYEVRSFWEDSAVEQNKTGHMSLRYRLSRSLETFVVRRADAVVGISGAILTDLQARGIHHAKLFHVPNGVDTSRFKPITRDASLAAQLGLNSVPTMGYLGTLFPWEGIPWLVRAAAELRRDGMQFKLLIVGDGAATSEVRAAVEDVRAGNCISFIGRVPHEQVERYYSVMDLLVYPRLKVRHADLVTPLKPLEAMALGKAVLGSSVGGIRELIEPEVTGVLFEPESVPDFCMQATRLLRDENLRHLLGRQARDKVSHDKDWKVLASRYEEIYAAAAHDARASS
jgi:glycogen(starch) synthase